MDKAKTLRKLNAQSLPKRDKTLEESHHSFAKTIQAKRKKYTGRKSPGDFEEFQDYIEYLKAIQGVK